MKKCAYTVVTSTDIPGSLYSSTFVFDVVGKTHRHRYTYPVRLFDVLPLSAPESFFTYELRNGLDLVLFRHLF